MNKALPLGAVDAGDVARRVVERHRDDDGKLADPPGADDLLGLTRFILDRVAKLPQAARHAEVQDGLLLTRLVEREVRRLQLQLLRFGIKDEMSARQLGRPLGIRSRQGVPDRVKALDNTLRAEAMHVPVEALYESPREVAVGSGQLREIAEALVVHWDDLLTDAEDSWMDGIAMVLGSAKVTAHSDGSLATQISELVDEIDENAASTGRPAARTPGAERALEAARGLRPRPTRPGPGA